MHISEERGPSTLPRYLRGGRTGTHDNGGPPTATASVQTGPTGPSNPFHDAASLLDRLAAVEAGIREDRYRQPAAVLEAIARLWSDGATVSETAADAGVSPHIVRDRLYRAGAFNSGYHERRRYVRDVLERQGPELVAAYEAGATAQALAARAGICDQTLKKFLMAHGIAIRDPRRRSREFVEAHGAELIAAYEAGATITALAARTGVPRDTIRAFLADHGTTIRRGPSGRAYAVLTAHGAALVAGYEAGASITAVAARAGIAQRTLRNHLVAHGVAIRVYRRRTPALSEARLEELVAAYEAGASLKALAAETGASSQTVGGFLAARGVQLRHDRGGHLPRQQSGG